MWSPRWRHERLSKSRFQRSIPPSREPADNTRDAFVSWIREENNEDLANFVRAMSINPTAMQAINQLGDAVSFGASTLTRVQEEAIATTVSVINKCRY